MIKNFPPHLLLFLLLVNCSTAVAQQRWESKGILFENNQVKLSIDYALSSSPCGAADDGSHYRIQILKNIVAKPLYVYWRFDFLNCDNELVSKNAWVLIKPGDRVTVQKNDFNFTGKRVVNLYYDVSVSDELLSRPLHKPTSSYSIEPATIDGDLSIQQGQTATLITHGGYLADDAQWWWYERDLNGRAIAAGPSIQVAPAHTTTYFVRGEGKFKSAPVAVTVKVRDENIAATSISGPAEICEGEKNVQLTVNGGHLSEGSEWVWYLGGTDQLVIGRGRMISVSPEGTSLYLVRAEGKTNLTNAIATTIEVAGLSTNPTAIHGPEKFISGQRIELAVLGGSLSNDAKWVWYAGPEGYRQQLGTGRQLMITVPNTDAIISVRGEGRCSNTEFVTKEIKVRNESHRTVNRSTFFINGGVVSDGTQNSLKSIYNYGVTIGNGKKVGWYLRYKFSSNKSMSDDETTGSLNGLSLLRRTAYTGGIYFGGNVLSLYLGGGYGKRDLLFGYTNNSSGTSGWIYDEAGSYEGAEGEAGLLIRIGVINIMGGINLNKDNYKDYYAGIGLNF